MVDPCHVVDPEVPLGHVRGARRDQCLGAPHVRLFDGNAWLTARSGDFLYVPEGGVHGFRGEEMTEERRAEFMVRHDTYWV